VKRAPVFVEHRRCKVAREPIAAFLAQRALRHADRPDSGRVASEWRDKAALGAFPDDIRPELDEAGGSTGTLEWAEHYWEADE
jgi:hypothetical protein